MIREEQLFLENLFVEIIKWLKTTMPGSELNGLQKQIKLSLNMGVFPYAIFKRLSDQLSDVGKALIIDKVMTLPSTMLKRLSDQLSDAGEVLLIDKVIMLPSANLIIQNWQKDTVSALDEGNFLRINPGDDSKLLHDYFDNETNSYKKNDPIEHLSNIENQFYIQNAGLALTYPFIPHYFKNLGLLDKEECFIHPEAQKKAVLLLHYLIWNHRPFTEGELVLNKIICGLSLSKAIDLNIFISRREKREGQKMLEALISNWPTLGSTDVGGLTEGFLKRAGKLYLEKGRFTLTVNQASIDIMLTKLDWPLSMIRLPFMKELIFIDW